MYLISSPGYADLTLICFQHHPSFAEELISMLETFTFIEP